MRVVVAGASGFVGGHLVPALRAAGHDVTTLVRRAPRSSGEAAWDPVSGLLPAAPVRSADVVINLCGAGVGDRRWTSARKRELRDSRLGPTRLLAQACRRHSVPALINASAVGYYGDRGDEVLTEADGPGDGFLARLCVDWEDAALPAAGDGVRVVRVRTGLVLGPDGGMLPRLGLLTKAGLVGRLGSGGQWWPWISVADHVSALLHLCRHDVHGPVNLTAPHPVTNREFTERLGRALRRPTPWVVPGGVLKAVLGDFAGEILGGQRALPAALTEAGFRFLHPDLDVALRANVR